MSIKEHDCIVLTCDLPEADLRAGDVGAVVHIHEGGAAYEVEFVALPGRAAAIATVKADAVREVGQHSCKK
jgi:hypothetical protein